MTDKIKRDIRDVDDFTKIEFRCWGHINLVQGDVCQLVVEAQPDLLDHLEISVEKDTLIIEFDKAFNKANWHKVFNKDDEINYSITLPTLESIKIMGKGSLTASTLTGDTLALVVPGVGNFDIEALHYRRVAIEVMGVSNSHFAQITGEALALSIKGTGKLSVEDVQTQSLAASIKGSGTMQLAGNVQNQSISMPGVGNYNAQYLESETAQLISNGMTNATLWVKQALNVTLRGMGNVSYYGNPTVKKQVQGIGRIKHAGATPKVKV